MGLTSHPCRFPRYNRSQDTLPDIPPGAPTVANPLDRLKDLHRKVFVKGQEAVADEIATRELKDQAERTQEALRLANETIDLANAMAQDGDPDKARLAAYAKARISGAAEYLLTGTGPEEGRVAAQASPFVERSLPSSEPSEKSLPESTTPKALPGEVEKRPPGRTRKDGTWPKRKKGS